MNKKYLVTGASGFIASHISDYLSLKGYNVILFDKKKSKFKRGNQKMIIGNVNNLKDITKATKNVHTIFHFAANADLSDSNKKPFETIENNILSTIKLLKASIKNKVKKIIFASSIYAISEQGGIYSTTKLSSEMIIERLCKKFNLKYVMLRFGTVYGERANKFNTVKKFVDDAISYKKIFRETKGNEIRSYIHVKDVTKIVFESTKKYEMGIIMYLAVRKLLKNLLNILKKNIPSLKVFYSNQIKENITIKSILSLTVKKRKKHKAKKIY